MSSLEGRRIVVTRSEAQSHGLCRALEEAGASVLRCPTIRIDPPESYGELDAALARLDEYRWMAFTSTNGVRAVMSRMVELGRSPAEVSGQRVAAVGASTAGALQAHGIRAAFVPVLERSRSLAESLEPVAGERILLTRADIAGGEVAETLRERGAARVDDVAVYRTIFTPPTPEVLEELRLGVDGITFTSPSTLRGFLELGPEWRELLGGTVVAALGPATTRAAQEEGLAVDVEATERTMRGLVDALRDAFEAAGPAAEETGT